VSPQLAQLWRKQSVVQGWRLSDDDENAYVGGEDQARQTWRALKEQTLSLRQRTWNCHSNTATAGKAAPSFSNLLVAGAQRIALNGHEVERSSRPGRLVAQKGVKWPRFRRHPSTSCSSMTLEISTTSGSLKLSSMHAPIRGPPAPICSWLLCNCNVLWQYCSGL
jgi:hypothetical protein